MEVVMDEGLDGGGVWYSIFIKNLAHYSSHWSFGLFIKSKKGGKEIWLFTIH